MGIEKNDTVVISGTQFVVTAVRNGSVFGVKSSAIDDSGTGAGAERFLGTCGELDAELNETFDDC